MHATICSEHDSNKVREWTQGARSHKLDVAHCDSGSKFDNAKYSVPKRGCTTYWP